MSRMRVEICLLNLHWREGDKHGRSRSRPREVVDVGGDRAPLGRHRDAGVSRNRTFRKRVAVYVYSVFSLGKLGPHVIVISTHRWPRKTR
jgi:hypothetical protein